MKKLKPYWFKPGTAKAFFIKNIEERYSKPKHLVIEPSLYKWKFPGACLFSQFEMSHGLVKVWLYSFLTSQGFRTSEDRRLFEFWVNPGSLVELSLEG